MPYKVHEIDTDEVLVRDENDKNIVECKSLIQAQLVVNALTMRDRMLKQLAQGFVDAIDNAESSAKMGTQWRGIIIGNGLSKDDSDELWEYVRDILEESKGPGQ